ncbi:MAG: hypothetical protein HKP58_07670 [Desulfatitalea sp.]|nr:hypothetical protein [Desulfatitalea sp.]NNK00277.1 hypothetical protein [Desulfatitalea sp.]
MKLRALKTEEELEWYRRSAHQYIDVLFPLEYLQRSRVVACLDDTGSICGGFIIVLEGPFRVLEQIPGGETVDLPIKTEKTAEITGLWRTKSWCKKHGSASLFIRLGFEIFRSRKKYFIYSYTLRKPHLGEIYSFVNPKVLYQGDVFLPGMDAADEESIEVFTVWNCLAALFRSPAFILPRLSPGRRNIGRRFLSAALRRLTFSFTPLTGRR